LPFEQPWDLFGGYDSVSTETYVDMNWLRQEWEPLEDGELLSYEPKYGSSVWELLKKYEEKVRVFERRPSNYGCCCLVFYVEYAPSIYSFILNIHSVQYYFSWCQKNGVSPCVPERIYVDNYEILQKNICSLL